MGSCMNLKVPLKRKFFSRFSIVQNISNTTAKKILAKKNFLLCFLRFKMLHFPPPSGECCSRSKGHVTGPCDARSCVDRENGWQQEENRVCGKFSWRESVKKQTAQMIFKHRAYRFIFSTKIVSLGRNLCRNGSVDFKAPTACPELCSWHFENTCSIDCLYLKCPLLEWTSRKALLKLVQKPRKNTCIMNNNFCNLSWHCATVWSIVSDVDPYEPDECLTVISTFRLN